MTVMPSYPVTCGGPGCRAPALFKVAAEWNDGTTREFKTYSLSCAACIDDHLVAAKIKHRLCRRTPGETLAAPTVYELAPERADRRLDRRDSEV